MVIEDPRPLGDFDNDRFIVSSDLMKRLQFFRDISSKMAGTKDLEIFRIYWFANEPQAHYQFSLFLEFNKVIFGG